MCWRIWHLARKKKQIAWDDAQRLAKRRLEREQGRNDAADDLSELSEGEKEKGDTNISESHNKDSPRIISDMQIWSDDDKPRRLYIVLISLHGLVRGENMELGRDSNTNQHYPDDEEDGELKTVVVTTNNNNEDNIGVGGAAVNRLRGWHPSSRIIRVSRASGGKDRHSKVWTSKGLRDRRVRLSVTTAIQFYDLQDRLGYDQPSKAVEWLIKAASDAIAELLSLNSSFPETPKQLSDEKRGSEEQEQDYDFDSAAAKAGNSEENVNWIVKGAVDREKSRGQLQ